MPTSINVCSQMASGRKVPLSITSLKKKVDPLDKYCEQLESMSTYNNSHLEVKKWEVMLLEAKGKIEMCKGKIAMRKQLVEAEKAEEELKMVKIQSAKELLRT